MSARSGSGEMSADLKMSPDGQAMWLVFQVTHDDAKIEQMFKAAKCAIDDSCNEDPVPDHLIVQCFIGGYDNDSRELWEIPESVELYKKLIKKGWYGLVLYPSKYGVTSAGEMLTNKDIKLAFYLPGDVAGSTGDAIDFKESVKAFNDTYA
jgi:hypothetical protein